ncbi:hypothetical protein GCM10023339_82160 [Alloalcanivorax gelatiniphagus]
MRYVLALALNARRPGGEPGGGLALRGFVKRPPVLLALHGIEEFGVGLGLLHAVDREFHRTDLVHGVELLAQTFVSC